MLAQLRFWAQALRSRHREKRLVAQLLRMSDHHLADLGLRRDQLQPDGIHALDVAPRRRLPRRQRGKAAVIRPSLQGCC